MQQALEGIIAAYNEAWNRHDADAIVAMHIEESVFENHTSGGKGVGKDAIREIVKGVFAAFPDIHFETRRIYVREDVVTQEWVATGTLAIPYTRGSMTVQPTGKKIAWNGVDVMPFTNGLVARKDVYADSIGFLRSLGFTHVDI